MSRLKLLHAADFHLDSPFEGLTAGKAAVRRTEQRDLLKRVASIALSEQVDLVLFSGDLLDSSNAYYETGEILLRTLKELTVPVFIAPGNHDYYTPHCPYAKLKFPENVHVFTDEQITCIALPELGVRVYGAAFTDSRCRPLLADFHAVRTDGVLNLLCMHGSVGSPSSIYNPVSEEMLSESGLDYAAFGHNHKSSGLRQAGATWYSWPGCPEGRGFDERGSKSVNLIEFTDNNNCMIKEIETSYRKYDILSVDVSDGDPLLRIHSVLPDNTMRDLYRIVLTGEVDRAPNLVRLQQNLDELFFSLQLKDETRLRQDIWEHCGEDTLRGLFLTKMYERYQNASETDRIRLEQAVRWGLAALDNREEVSVCEDS